MELVLSLTVSDAEGLTHIHMVSLDHDHYSILYYVACVQQFSESEVRLVSTLCLTFFFVGKSNWLKRPCHFGGLQYKPSNTVTTSLFYPIICALTVDVDPMPTCLRTLLSAGIYSNV